MVFFSIGIELGGRLVDSVLWVVWTPLLQPGEGQEDVILIVWAGSTAWYSTVEDVESFKN